MSRDAVDTAVAVAFTAFMAWLMLAGPLVGPAGPRQPVAPPRHPAVAALADPPPPVETPDPLDPAWRPSGGVWAPPATFHDVAARHPVMYALGAV